MKVQVSNPDLSFDERTYLTEDYSSGTNLNVRNNEGYTTSWFAIVGEPGQEQTEAKTVSGVSSNTVIQISAALNFSHPKSTAVYLSQWDKISFERKPSGGAYAEISSSPLNIEWDDADLTTLVVVDGGASTDTYRWRFYNSALGTYSDYSGALPGTGYGRNTVGYVLEQVRRNPATESVADEVLIDYMNDYQSNVVYPEIPKAWWFSKEGEAAATIADTYKYNISTNWDDFLSMNIMLYNFISGTINNTYPLTWSPIAEFYNLKADSTQSADDNAKYWTLLPPDSSSAKGYIAIHPTSDTTACRLKPVYFFELTDLADFDDELVVPLPKGYIDYVLYRVFDDIKSDAGNADKFNQRVKQGILYLKKLARRQLGQPELFRFRGIRGWSALFGSGGREASPTSRELYW